MPISCGWKRVSLCCLASFLLSACGPPKIGKEPELSAEADAVLAEIGRLERDVERLKSINAIKRLQRAYGYYLDRSDWDNVLDLLTGDATAEYGPSGVYRGRDSIRGLLYGIGYGEAGLQPEQLREHIQLQPVITLADDGMTAKGRWRVLGLLGQYQEYARWQAGPYENEYRKEDGVWKISKIHWKETFTVPFEGGWAAAMEQSNVEDRQLPAPDAPSSFEYEPWPGVSLLPFHFEHTVRED